MVKTDVRNKSIDKKRAYGNVDTNEAVCFCLTAQMVRVGLMIKDN